MYFNIAKQSLMPGPNLEYSSTPQRVNFYQRNECLFLYALAIQKLGCSGFQLRLIRRLSSYLFFPAFIQTIMNFIISEYQYMSIASIANIKIPNKFIFNIEEAVDLTAVRKEKTFCKVEILRYQGTRYALKTINKKEIPEERFEEEYRRVANQIKILYQLDHPNVVKLYYHQQTSDQIRMLMEYGGVRLKSHFKTTFHAQDEVKMITKQILQALKYVHDQGYIHRDLQPQNILLNKQENRIKLIDFGFIDEVAFRRTKIGSYAYMAPEITGDNNYNQKVDIWSLGVIVYEMLHNDLPFCSTKNFDEDVFQQNKRKGKLHFDNQVSNQAINFIKRMLALDPEMRASASELLRHQFISPQDDLSIFDREGTDKTHKLPYNRQKSEPKVEEDIQQLQAHAKRISGEVFAGFHHQKQVICEIIKSYKQILSASIAEKQKRKR